MKFIFFFLFALSLPCNQSQAVKSFLDLHGNENNLTEVDLPHSYYPRPSQRPKFSFISQGAYGEYEKSNVDNLRVVIGPLEPCMGIIVANAEHLLTFHLHWSNDLKHMNDLISAYFGSKKDSVFVNIFTTSDKNDWKKDKNDQVYRALTHEDAVKQLKEYFLKIGISQENIRQTIYNQCNSEGQRFSSVQDLGKYKHARSYIAVNPEEAMSAVAKKDIFPIYSIDPCAEDILEQYTKEFTSLYFSQLEGEYPSSDEEEELQDCKLQFSELSLIEKRLVYDEELKNYGKNLYKDFFHTENVEDLFTKETDGNMDKIIRTRPFMPVK